MAELEIMSSKKPNQTLWLLFFPQRRPLWGEASVLFTLNRLLTDNIHIRPIPSLVLPQHTWGLAIIFTFTGEKGETSVVCYTHTV